MLGASEGRLRTEDGEILLAPAALDALFRKSSRERSADPQSLTSQNHCTEMREKMTSGQNNIIVSEVGYCDDEINEALESPLCEGEGETATEAASNLTTMLESGLPYREAGWLKAALSLSSTRARPAGGQCRNTRARCSAKAANHSSICELVWLSGAWSTQSTPNPLEGGINNLLASVVMHVG